MAAVTARRRVRHRCRRRSSIPGFPRFPLSGVAQCGPIAPARVGRCATARLQPDPRAPRLTPAAVQCAGSGLPARFL
jgi:hypothetical protein